MSNEKQIRYRQWPRSYGGTLHQGRNGARHDE
jgi:hypothetical protein